ncbi:phenol hydroxylase [Nitrogeniibacter mangrovi]|uniref:Phenol hydroxylase n=1 Tax=Nitrogeniibacter mangrovi TaxID=2016596 RepID=A0A6C1AY11_9RHOO|nr:aromatic/alkene monooxygenase hydroxylase subunit beta [Nitrogeniibacter mangrovi]QID16227.1 phenol hydroxylase [Nitrogeniibacter mangrovi]
MQIDLRTVSIKPLRNTFDHLVRRFGDKPASRYQEGSYEIQADANLQYRPSWDPEHELHDPKRTALVMADWYAFKDPRQFYYGTYTLTRARQQDSAEANFDFVETRGLLAQLGDDDRRLALEVLMPLRHAAWGANMNNTGMCADGYGTLITQPCMFAAMDNLGVAQYLTRVGLALGDTEALAAGREAWINDAAWQPLRRLVEKTLVTRDWFELLVAQNFVSDGLLYPLIYEQFVDTRLGARGGAGVSLMCVFMTEWHAEMRKWIDAVIKTAAKESEANRDLLTGWTRTWRDRAVEALGPIADKAFGTDAAAILDTITQSFNARAAKLGLDL